MALNSKVVWSEGLFLQPQHFQQQERYAEHLVMHRPNVSGFSNWGVTALEIDEHLLTLGKIALIKCKGILPDGTAFDIPGHQSAPTPIDVPNNITDSFIYLALPLNYLGSPYASNSSDEHPELYRYRREFIEVADTNMGSNTTQIQVNRLSFRLMLESEGGYSYLAIAKIKESLSNRQVCLDPHFLPSCLDVHAVPEFVNFISELLGLLRYRGDTIVQYINGSDHTGVSEVSDFMLLQLINRSETICNFISTKRGIHPESFFAYLIQLMGELATFTSKSKRPIKIPSYNHDDLQNSFSPIIDEIRRALSVVLEKNAIQLRLEPQKYGIWVSPITDRTLLDHTDFILAVGANVAPDILREQLIAQIKVAPVEMVQSLINRALPGISLRSLVVVPRQIHYNTGFVYFSLDKNHAYWKELTSSGGIAIQIGNDFPGLELQLWAIRGNT